MNFFLPSFSTDLIVLPIKRAAKLAYGNLYVLLQYNGYLYPGHTIMYRITYTSSHNIMHVSIPVITLELIVYVGSVSFFLVVVTMIINLTIFARQYSIKRGPIGSDMLHTTNDFIIGCTRGKFD